MPRGPDREHLKISPFDNCLRHSFLSTHSNNIVTSASCENWSYGICGQCNSRPACAVWSGAMLSAIKKSTQGFMASPEYPPQYAFPDQTVWTRRLDCSYVGNILHKSHILHDAGLYKSCCLVKMEHQTSILSDRKLKSHCVIYSKLANVSSLFWLAGKIFRQTDCVRHTCVVR
jgi:hypothetical protein